MSSTPSLIKEMKIKTGAVVVSQEDKNETSYINNYGQEIKFIRSDNRGVGRSRNLAIINATADICLIADEDMIYVDNYEKIVFDEFKKRPDADIILFSIESLNPDRPCYEETRNHIVNKLNFMKYGACRVAFRRESILKNNIFFSLMFGGGARYGSGEDSIFLNDCLKYGLKIYACTKKIADVKQEESSWFTGFNKKYYFDKGALFSAMGKYNSLLLIPLMAIRGKNEFKDKFSVKQVIDFMVKGRKDYLGK
jgi:glycosyltransferase involved in cell wall biosynthesis